MDQSTNLVTLIPGDNGTNCPGNGQHQDKDGQLIECCCDECDYFLLCFPEYDFSTPGIA